MKLLLKSCLIMTVMGMCTIPGFASDWKMGGSGMCAVHDHSGFLGMGHDDVFYYCGEQAENCAGVTDNSGDEANWQKHKDSFLYGGNEKMWCCNKDGVQKYVKGYGESQEWIKGKEVKTENVGGGKCSWVAKINVCDQIDNPEDKCTEPTNCDKAGDIVYKGRCTTPCGKGQEFRQTNDDTISCVDCPNDGYHGVVESVRNNGDECVICDSATSFFDPGTKKCEAYSDYHQVTPNAHKGCWMCTSAAAEYQCFVDYAQSGGVTRPELKTADGASGVCGLNGRVKDKEEQERVAKFTIPEPKKSSTPDKGILSEIYYNLENAGLNRVAFAMHNLIKTCEMGGCDNGRQCSRDTDGTDKTNEDGYNPDGNNCLQKNENGQLVIVSNYMDPGKLRENIGDIDWTRLKNCKGKDAARLLNATNEEMFAKTFLRLFAKVSGAQNLDCPSYITE